MLGVDALRERLVLRGAMDGLEINRPIRYLARRELLSDPGPRLLGQNKLSCEVFHVNLPGADVA